MVDIKVFNSTLALYTHCFMLRIKGVPEGSFFGLI